MLRHAGVTSVPTGFDASGSPAGKMSSHLTETVSINYDDFSDSFLTCGTCLCTYDALERTPKLLQCSHTVCRSCLQRILEAAAAGTGSGGAEGGGALRCPICRETMAVPRGGVAAFPPSFIVNQLLDLMAAQRRDVVPRCAAHLHRELLFCETCDVVFCCDCDDDDGGGGGGGSAAERHGNGTGRAHTVIPLSVAIKRMSEILLYRAGLCARRLEAASAAVALEAERVEAAAERCAEHAAKAFEDLLATVEQRRHAIAQAVRRLRQQKLAGLREQLAMIEAEQARVRADCHASLPPESQVEVRNITKRISDLNEKLDVSASLSEPRENAFLRFESDHNDACEAFTRAVNAFGRIRVSTTLPALCTTALPPALTVRLRAAVVIVTVDHHGVGRTTGGDPLTARLCGPDGADVGTAVTDVGDGSYEVEFTAAEEGRHWLHVAVFERAIRGSPFTLDASCRLAASARVVTHAGRAFVQPVAVALRRDAAGDERLYVLDAGNARVCALPAAAVAGMGGVGVGVGRHVSGPGLEQRGGTGMAVTADGDVVVTNWRTLQVSVLRTRDDGDDTADVVAKWTSPELVEPTCVAVTPDGDVVVADNGARALFVFDGATGRLTHRVAADGDHRVRLVGGIHVTPAGDIVVADDRLQVFSAAGVFLRQVASHGGAGGQYGGVTTDGGGRLLATRSRRGRAVVEVYDASGAWLLDIDSAGDALRRPSGLVTSHDGHVFVADLGNNCVKKFRYL